MLARRCGGTTLPAQTYPSVSTELRLCLSLKGDCITGWRCLKVSNTDGMDGSIDLWRRRDQAQFLRSKLQTAMDRSFPRSEALPSTDDLTDWCGQANAWQDIWAGDSGLLLRAQDNVKRLQQQK